MQMTCQQQQPQHMCLMVCCFSLFSLFAATLYTCSCISHPACGSQIARLELLTCHQQQRLHVYASNSRARV